ncbi:hypothetical protein ATY77_09415 [Rhizobium sp. R634]|uniref:hypothetical protein n=1 Tax=unclassified Rhizobium TaxID=2613769 RepID=UPI000B52DF50|nr:MULTISPECIES: hypothetical protein [unclassified Rhizobium]OWV65505.1 hypothetical protein ATY76_19980 [Rhizobium sp. R339]OWV73193.1 hypothetical protein ATY77_08165 [Rhizobium sp. R634]OWV73412.1 hypothetical protein ATY77_09415 [Rhizobium sp. R634]
MKLVPFQYAGHNPAMVYINPEQVVAVREFANSTHIHVAAPQKDGAPSYYPVRETVDEVVKKLTA